MAAAAQRELEIRSFDTTLASRDRSSARGRGEAGRTDRAGGHVPDLAAGENACRRFGADRCFANHAAHLYGGLGVLEISSCY
jgi:hypothetical protein